VSFVLLSLTTVSSDHSGTSRRTFPVNIDTIPDITMRGQADPHGRVTVRRPPTVGQLAARLAELAARPLDWGRLAPPDPTAQVRMRLSLGTDTGLDPADFAGIEVWLTIWPPGHRTAVHDHTAPGVSTVIAGELAEVIIAAHGVTERPLPAGRVRVHGGGHTHQLANPGTSHAITLHAGLAG
jgi:cysteine dioxygenase type I